ncbi:hypothetical protein HZC00_04475 [Candidatus Kaiserbacteria bacterium]|nr:hypothetical protein [Candidatus Kaiserbacteria bacterium]
MSDDRLTIGSSIERLVATFSSSDALTMNRNDRYSFLVLACADLARCVRKEKTGLYPIALAQIVAWFASLAEELFRTDAGLLLTNAMGDKFPAMGCGYCGHFPCICEEAHRAEHVVSVPSTSQYLWSINRWQEHLEQLYGPNNSTGGIPRALNRLFEEVAEVGLILHSADGFNDNLKDVRRKYAQEFTDVLAWTFACASLLKISLEDSVISLYGSECPVCRSFPCNCRHFEKKPSGECTHRFMSAQDIYDAIRAK